MRIASIVALVALAGVPVAAIAQTAVPSASVPAASGAPPVATPQRSDMSPEAKARMEKFRAACGADLQTHCAAVQAKGEQAKSDQGRGEMRTCIDANKVKFSMSCQAAITDRDAAREARKQTAPASGTDKPKS